MYHGVVNVYKERGYTSFDVVAAMRGIFGQRKIGHTGTLDPQAEGVLVVCLGNASKLCSVLTDTDKVYRAVMRLGVETDTQDMTGTVLAEKSPGGISREMLLGALDKFTGEISQIPPMYSAKKVGGKKLCDLAREGKTVERKPSAVKIYDIKLLGFDNPTAELLISCSKGTYIRTLINDLGAELGCGAAMESLVRTLAAGQSIDKSIRLDELKSLKEKGRLSDAVIPTDSFFSDYPAVAVSEAGEGRLCNGNPVGISFIAAGTAPGEIRDGQTVRMYGASGKFKAIYRYDEKRQAFYPVRMFLED